MKRILLFLPLIVLFLGCIKNNDNPAWIEITPWTLEANQSLNGNEGALTSNFSHSWVYVNGNLVGIFELPAKIPVLASGTAVITVYPAILNNGISATKKIYPFVQEHEITTVLVANEVVLINPVTRYKNSLSFWINDFESPDTGFTADPNTSDTDMVAESDPQYVQWGSSYGAINLTTDKSHFVGYTSLSKYLPTGQDVYLEIDYLNSNTIVTGLVEISSQNVENHINIQMNAQTPGSEVWKKIYIDLRELVAGTPQAEVYKISLEAYLDDGGIDRQIRLDNVKVVHF